jgi:transposase
MEATIFTGWIYDHLLPHAEKVKVAHPLMLRAIAAAKKKSDTIDGGKIADCLRCDFLPECHMVSTEIRDRRRTSRYRHLLVRQMVQMKNRVSGLLMETGAEHNKQRLHKVGYFHELLSTQPEVPVCIRPLLKISRDTIERCRKAEYALVSSLQRDPILADRIKRLRTIPGVGPITTLDVGPANPDQNTAHTLPSWFAIFSGAFRPRRIHGQSIARSPSNDNLTSGAPAAPTRKVTVRSA